MGFMDLLGSVFEIGSEVLGNAAEKERRKRSEIRRKYNIDDSESSSSTRRTSSTHKTRGTKEDFRNNRTGMNKSPRDFSYCTRMLLRDAKSDAPGEPGVYILYLDGEVMKCGVATYSQGIRWRFTQYYNLNYDDKARDGDYWSISPENRDRVYVAWQACPKRVCDELEYKLFRKYGKGPWAKRAPSNLSTDEWELLI